MNNEFFKVKLLKEENYKTEPIDEEDDDIDINLVMDRNSKIIQKEAFDKLFKTDNKESNQKENVKRKNPYSTDGNRQKKTIIDPEKRPYIKMTIKQLEDQIEQYKKNISEIKNKPSNIEEIEKYKKLSDKWLKISQEAIYTILQMFPQNHLYEKNTIKSVIQHFKIEKESLNYNSEDDCFD